jgi:hypothetical protein
MGKISSRIAILILFLRIYILEVISFPKRYHTYSLRRDLSPLGGLKVENFEPLDQPKGVNLNRV